jgi:hypothetical protein
MWEHSIPPMDSLRYRSPFELSQSLNSARWQTPDGHLLTGHQLAPPHFLKVGSFGVPGGLAPTSGLYVRIRNRESIRMMPMPSA